MGETKLREYIRKQIKLEMSSDKSLNKEGIMDSVLNHIQNVLKKSRDKKFDSAMSKLAKSGPEGEKAAKHYYKSVDLIQNAAQNLDYNKYD